MLRTTKTNKLKSLQVQYSTCKKQVKRLELVKANIENNRKKLNVYKNTEDVGTLRILNKELHKVQNAIVEVKEKMDDIVLQASILKKTIYFN